MDSVMASRIEEYLEASVAAIRHETIVLFLAVEQ